MGVRSFFSVVVPVGLLASLLTGCQLFGAAPRDQLDRIVAETGDQVVGVEVGGKTVGSKALVSVFWVRDGQLLLSKIDGDKVVTEESDHTAFASSGPIDIEHFSLDSLVTETKGLLDKDGCRIASVKSLVTPTGGVGTTVECSSDDRQVAEKSTLNGEPFYLPTLDLRSSADVDTLVKSYTTLMGTSETYGVLYTFKDGFINIDAPAMSDAAGNACAPFVAVYANAPSILFPAYCDPAKDTRQGASFKLTDYDPGEIAVVISGLRSNPVLNQSQISGVTFAAEGGSIAWGANTTDLSDVMNYPDQLSGYIQKKP